MLTKPSKIDSALYKMNISFPHVFFLQFYVNDILKKKRYIKYEIKFAFNFAEIR